MMIFYNRRGKIRLLACCSCALSGVRATGYYYGAPHEPWNRRDGRRRGIAAGRSQCWASAGGAQPSGPRNVREDGKGTQGCAEKAEGESGRFLHVRRRRPIPVRSRVRRAVFRARLFFFFYLDEECSRTRPRVILQWKETMLCIHQSFEIYGAHYSKHTGSVDSNSRGGDRCRLAAEVTLH